MSTDARAAPAVAIPPRLPMLATALIVALTLSACGAERGQPPSLEQAPAKPGMFFKTKLAKGDVSLAYPHTWDLNVLRPPGVATTASGDASLTVWAYPAVSVVIDNATRKAALGRLLASLKKRDPSLKVTRTSSLEVDGAPALEIRGLDERGGRRIAVRSVHVYKGAGEYVVDALADRRFFVRTNRRGLRPGDRQPSPRG